MNKLNKKGGFTLIEILVVIGIIAILATIVLIAINPARQFAQANNTQRSANVNAILNAIGQYMADNKGALPLPLSGEVDATLCGKLVPTYIPAIPTDPKSASKGTSIDCSGLTGGDVKYNTSVSSSNRVTVFAPETELKSESGAPVYSCDGSTNTKDICVIR